ncbi:NAD(P)H-dependent flavin oxidoreductase [Limosilactobacillus fastidiosus]|uniref:Probable nitronate monooxygenase n=1 Tax=Limosilactobacillus fastidiosus TaxID=2759855 RepID=A0A7W3YCK1_9LACO|nr:nitronate monooxygenase [Limosilactobacillus fastidiosus]MBB1086206.1 nitronate monooxygenase [Limosilactobacillus fastidiosus]MCD7086523.1 nitronate monooxygenase [Limosilactobacillus fastidiosus]MCD7114964.1 nitronate monooxygenase [Limosilactobacillus fastidiosus]MCD7116641.1 nitronate monooxygenase [Limosilactobacillus fastidiosus]
MKSQSRITKVLNIEKPIIQGPMTWLTDARLVAAVSNAGGLGVLGPNAGQTTPATSVEEAVEKMRIEIQKTKKLTTKPFGLSLLPGEAEKDPFTVPMIKMAAEEKVAAVTYVGNVIRPELFEMLRQNNIKIIYRALCPNLKVAKEAEKYGADIIAVTGFDHGGDLPKKTISNFDLIPMTVDAVDIPIVADGGIADARGVKAAFALGAEGIYSGTVFITSDECRANNEVKKMIVKNDAEDLLLFRTAPAPYYRSLPTKLANHLVQMDKEGVPSTEIGQAMRGGIKAAMFDGDFDHGYISVGNGISNIHAIRPVSAIINDLMQGIE